MTLSLLQIAGLVLVIIAIALAGFFSGRKVSSAKDFTSGGGKAGSLVVSGALMGTLISGQSTVGTAQLAFSFGISAWWWSLGCGIGCLLLFFFYGVSIRSTGLKTETAIISREYGNTAAYLASVLSSIGIFISMLSQIIAFSALLKTVSPLNTVACSVISVIIMTAYVIFGGVWGAGIGGIIKLILLYVSSITAGIAVLSMTHGVTGLDGMLRSLLAGTNLGKLHEINTDADFTHTYWNMFARGPFKDLGSGLSLVLGVLSTQTYASAICSAKTDSQAKKGALISAVLTPPIGIACILIGLFMRGKCITVSEAESLKAAGQLIPENLLVLQTTAQVFPMFVTNYLPKFIGGIVLGTLLITIVGGGAGLSLGVATVISNDIICRLTDKFDEPEKHLLLVRAVILVMLILAAIIAAFVPTAIINDFGYLSMGLRGTVIFLPLTMALYAPGKIKSGFTVAAIVIAPVTVLVFGLLKVLPFDALFLGIAIEAVIFAAGFIYNTAGRKTENTDK